MAPRFVIVTDHVQEAASVLSRVFEYWSGLSMYEWLNWPQFLYADFTMNASVWSFVDEVTSANNMHAQMPSRSSVVMLIMALSVACVRHTLLLRRSRCILRAHGQVERLKKHA